MKLKKTEDIWENVFTQNMQKLVVKTIGPKFQSLTKVEVQSFMPVRYRKLRGKCSNTGEMCSG